MSDPNRPWTKQAYPGNSSLTNEAAPIAANLLRGQDGGQSPARYQPPTPEQIRKQAVRKMAWHYCRAAAYAFLAVVFAIAAASLVRGDGGGAVVGFAFTGVLVLLSLRSLRKARRLRETSSGDMRWLKEHKELLGIIIGILSLLLAILVPLANAYHWPPFPSSSSPSPTPALVAGSKSPGPTPATTAPSISPGPTSTGSAAFTRSVEITFSGIDFDSNPLGSGPDNITWERYTYTLQGYGSVIVSRYPSSGALPTEAACRSWAQANNSHILSGVNRGDRLCFITQDGRTVRFIVTNFSNDAVEGQATVWNDGNQ